MKIVKLNKRYKNFKKFGHTVAIKFDGWGDQAREVESHLSDIYGMFNITMWNGYFGKPVETRHMVCVTVRPYWITVKDPADLTLVLLKLNT